MTVKEISRIVQVPSIDVLDYLNFVGVDVTNEDSNVADLILADTVISRLFATKDEFDKVYFKTPF